MLSFIRSHKIISGVILINVIAVAWLIAAIIIHDKKTAMIDIMVAPSDAKILINGRNYDNFSSANFLPGEYKAEISMEGMQTRTIDFTLNDNDFYRLYVYLLDNDGGFKYYDSRVEEVRKLETIAKFNADDEELNKYIEEFNRIYGILDVLPLYYGGESGVYIDEAGIRYDEQSGKIIRGSKCDSIVCLEVYSENKDRDSVNNLIREAGYEPNKYTIFFGDEEQ